MRMKTMSTDMPVEMGSCGPPRSRILLQPHMSPESPTTCNSVTRRWLFSTRFELAWQRVDILHAKYEREAGLHFQIADTLFVLMCNRSLKITRQCPCQQWRVEARCITGGRQPRQAPPGPLPQRRAFYYYIIRQFISKYKVECVHCWKNYFQISTKNVKEILSKIDSDSRSLLTHWLIILTRKLMLNYKMTDSQ